jgi:hypothetical protein
VFEPEWKPGCSRSKPVAPGATLLLPEQACCSPDVDARNQADFLLMFVA